MLSISKKKKGSSIKSVFRICTFTQIYSVCLTSNRKCRPSCQNEPETDYLRYQPQWPHTPDTGSSGPPLPTSFPPEKRWMSRWSVEHKDTMIARKWIFTAHEDVTYAALGYEEILWCHLSVSTLQIFLPAKLIRFITWQHINQRSALCKEYFTLNLCTFIRIYHDE